jgi:hypothetical protein
MNLDFGGERGEYRAPGQFRELTDSGFGGPGQSRGERRCQSVADW